MLRVLLLVFIAISEICCQSYCPIYSSLKNNASLINELNGTFYKIIATTTGAIIADCQIQSFKIGPNNTIVDGYLQSRDWCLHMTNCNLSKTAYECDLVPITSATPPTLTSSQRNSIKLVEKIGKGDSLCLIYSYCRTSEEGVYLLCRKKPKLFITLLLLIIRLLRSVINLVIPLPDLKIVNQANCKFSNTCPSP